MFIIIITRPPVIIFFGEGRDTHPCLNINDCLQFSITTGKEEIVHEDRSFVCDVT